MANYVEPYLSRYFHGKGVKLGLPVNGTFELTPCCNLKCRMCYVRQEMSAVREAGGLRSGDWWLKLGQEAVDAGMIFLLLTGGEPLTHPDFKEIYTGLKKLGLMLSINTNGTLIDEEMADFLAANAPTRVNMTLYGASWETYGDLCGQPEAFDRAVRGLKLLRQRGISVKVNVSVTPWNRADMDEIVNIARENGAQVQCAAYMFPPLRRDADLVGQNQRFTPEEAAKCHVYGQQLMLSPERFRQRAIQMHNGTVQPDAHAECMDQPGEPIRCRAGRAAFWVAWNGNLMPCGMMTRPTVSMLETPFSTAWEQIRRKAAQIRIPSRCTTCEKRHACSVCAASCLTETGEFDCVPEYLCRMAEGVIAETEKFYMEQELSE